MGRFDHSGYLHRQRYRIRAHHRDPLLPGGDIKPVAKRICFPIGICFTKRLTEPFSQCLKFCFRINKPVGVGIKLCFRF